MNKTVSRLLALAMTASLVLSGCGGGGTTTEEKPAEGGNTTEQSGEKKEEAKKEDKKEASKDEIKDLVRPIIASRELETRYADDFIITCENRETLEKEIKPLVADFMSERGLTLSEEKTVKIGRAHV